MNNPYQALKSQPPATLNDAYDVPVDGAAGRISITRARLFVAARLLVDGEPAKRANRHAFHLPMSDGSTAEARFKPSLTRAIPSLAVNGRRYDVGPSIGAGYMVLTVLPLGLVGIGGALGGFLGAIAAAINREIAFSSNPGWLKVIAMLLITFSAAVLYFMAAAFIFSAFHRPQ